MDFLTAAKLLDEAIDTEKLIGQLIDHVTNYIDSGDYYNPRCNELLCLLEGVVSSGYPVSSTLSSHILDKVGLPMLWKVNPSYNSGLECVSLISSVSSLCASCLQFAEENKTLSLIGHCCNSLRSYTTEVALQTEDSSVLDIHGCLGMVQNLTDHRRLQLSKTVLKKLNELFSDLIGTLHHVKNNILLNMFLSCLSNFLNMSPVEDKMTQCWMLIHKSWEADKYSEKPLLLLCGLANYFFPVKCTSVSPDLKCEELFWRILQWGVSHGSPVTRKRTSYLLKRVTDICESCNLTCCGGELFSWNPSTNLSQMWEDYILLMESLEEKQVHVIKPLLPRLYDLIKATHIQENGTFVLHTSWLTALFRRMMKHESIYIIRWTADLILNLDLHLCPMLQQGQDTVLNLLTAIVLVLNSVNYLCKEFLLSLQEPKLYVRSERDDLGSSPGCGRSVGIFFQNCWSVLKSSTARANFFRNLLSTVIDNTWSQIPLLFIFEGFSKIEKSPILNGSGVQELRQSLIHNLRTCDNYMRSAMQSFCGQILLNLINPDEVSVDEFSSALSLFVRDECLLRGAAFWSKVTDWLKSTSESNLRWSGDGLRGYLKETVTKMLNVTDEDAVAYCDSDFSALARMLLLCADAGILPVKRSTELDLCSLQDILMILSSVINAVPTHPYLSAIKIQHAMEMLFMMTEELGRSSDDDVGRCVKKTVEQTKHSLVIYTQQSLTEKWNQLKDISSINLCCRMLSLAVSGSCDESLSCHIEKLMDDCTRCLNAKSQESVQDQIQRLGASVLISSITCHMTDCKLSERIYNRVQKYVRESLIPSSFNKPVSDISQKEWGKITSQFMLSQWQVLNFYLKMSHPDSWCITMETCLDSLAIGSGDTSLAIFECIAHLIRVMVEKESAVKVVEVLEVVWGHVREQGKGSSYLLFMEEYIKMVFQTKLVQQPTESQISIKLQSIASKLLEIGSEKAGVVNILVQTLTSVASHNTMLTHVQKFVSVFIHCCLFGNIYKKQDRQLVDVYAYISLGSSYMINQIQIQPWYPKDVMVRISMINFLCTLDPENREHQTFVSTLISAIWTKYEELLKVMSGQSFCNSLAHRQKLRLVQAAIVLDKFILQTESEKTLEMVMDLLTLEMQISVRHYLEWMVMRLVYRFNNLLPKFWNFFSSLTEKKNQGLCSLMCVMSQLGPALQPGEKEMFYDTAFEQLLTWCMGSNFNTRIHTLVVLQILWQQCHKQQLKCVLDKHAMIKGCFSRLDEDNNITKNVKRLMQNYFLSTFDFQQDYSIETIFSTLPRLALLSDDEWIPLTYFYQFPQKSVIPLRNPNNSLSTCEEGAWRFRSIVEHGETEAENREGDIQKKIMPWKQMNPDDDVVEEMKHAKSQHKSKGLVLVTSLIDKVPNLGGLCRTSEIFGVSEFVLNKLKYVEDKVFQTLSVTAHKWLPIKEVYHTCLPEYLQQMKSQGYALVGVEQTANSVSLTDFKFPTKTLLLLGNEKEGLPANMISLLDVCVEIPQQGMVRSLNVHVSGAIFIWEYTRQQIKRRTCDL